ncbi:MAG: hypothetical protein AB7O37_16200 [Vicinamibacteria bacterium]
MKTPDDALDALRTIAEEFATFCAQRGAASEADTRAKVIDRVLTEVLGWPEEQLSREDRCAGGFSDYQLRLHNRPFVVVEAKKEGASFTLPIGNDHRALKLNGVLSTDASIRAAIDQVWEYCVNVGSRYAVATNGYSWITFRAIREDLPWREGVARVFHGLDTIQERFVEFWNLLAYSAIASGALDTEFGSSHRIDRRLGRVLDELFNADLPLQRNRLHAQIHPIIKSFFEDIAEQDQPEILQSCYVHSHSLRIVADDLNVVITDAVPAFLANEGAEEVKSGEGHSGRFERALIQAVHQPAAQGHLFLLLGGIGAGKTTFLKRYQKSVGKELLSTAFYFHIDFLKAPLDSRELEAFVWSEVIGQVRTRLELPRLRGQVSYAAPLSAACCLS